MNKTIITAQQDAKREQQKTSLPGKHLPGTQENDAATPQNNNPEPEDGVTSIFVDGLFQFFTGLLLFIALLYRQTGLVILALLILIMINGARLWCRLSLAGLSCRYGIDKEKVFPDEGVIFKAQVENHRFLPVWMKIKIPLGKTFFPSFPDNGGISGENVLLWKQKVSLQWELTARRRGCFPVGPAELAAGDPLGFFQQKKRVSHSGEIIVFPRLIPLKNISFLQEEFFGTQGTSSPVPDPVYPVATRDYHHGRPARHIHWKASARHNRLQEKIFEPTAHGKSLLVVDVKQFAENKAEDAFERTLEAAASIAVKMEQQGISVGIASNGSLAGGGRAILPAAGGTGQLSAILEMLARMQMEYLEDVENVFKLGTYLSRGTVCTCFFLQPDDSLLLMKELLKRYQIPSIFITGQSSYGLKATGGKIYSLHELCE